MSGIRTVIDGVRFGEGARWRDEALWYSEMFASRVMRFDPRSGASEIVCEVADGTPSGLGFLPDGRLLVVHMQRCAILRLDAPGRLVLHADLSRDAVCLLNDMAVAPNGDAYVGSTGRNFFTGDTVKRLANVILVRPDGSSEVLADGIAGPNGAVVTRRFERPTPVICCALGGKQLYFFRIAPGSALDSTATGHFEAVEVEIGAHRQGSKENGRRAP